MEAQEGSQIWHLIKGSPETDRKPRREKNIGDAHVLFDGAQRSNVDYFIFYFKNVKKRNHKDAV